MGAEREKIDEKRWREERDFLGKKVGRDGNGKGGGGGGGESNKNERLHKQRAKSSSEKRK